MPKEKKRVFRLTNTFYRKKKQLLSDLKNQEVLARQSQETTQEVRLTEPHGSNSCPTVDEPPLSPVSKGIVENEEYSDNNDYFLDDTQDNLDNTIETENYSLSGTDTDSENDESKQTIFKVNLREWALKHSLTEIAIKELLLMLSKQGIKGLPTDSRTLLRRPKQVILETMDDNGQFWYQGIDTCLKYISLKNTITELKLNFNVDGLPIAKSSKKQFWPILMSIANIPEISPLIIAIYCGDGKPKNAKIFLHKFVEELNELIRSGFQTIDDRKLTIKVNAIICDTPARAFIKCIVSHNAYFSCQKCIVKGQYHRNGRHISFPQTDCELRTDTSFRNHSNSEHHQKDKTTDEFLKSPLEDLPIDMIKDIPVADALHLIDLGLVKRCLSGWVNGSYNFRSKFFAPQINEISVWLKGSNSCIPSEIHRSVRGLDCIAFWKGTEFRVFLLYLGPVILKDHLSEETYKHFLLLSCAITILSSDFYISKPKYVSAAENMLNDYIDIFITLFGIDAVSSNVHNLCHIVEDVKRFGSLNNISSYVFENVLGMLKNLLKKGHQPLAQVAKRLIEKSSIHSKNHIKKTSIFKYEIDNEYEIPGVKVLYKSVNISGVKLQVGKKNQWFLTKQNEAVKMLGAFQLAGNTYLYGCSLKKDLYCNFYTYPFESKDLNIFFSCERFNPPKSYLDKEIKSKLVGLEYKNKLIFFPLLHTLDIFNKA